MPPAFRELLTSIFFWTTLENKMRQIDLAERVGIQEAYLVHLGERQERAMPGSYTNAGRGPGCIAQKIVLGLVNWARIYTFGFGVSVRDVPQRLKPEDFIELYRRSKEPV